VSNGAVAEHATEPGAFACRPEVAALPRYNAGLSVAAVRSRYAVERIAKLASNENPEGCSPHAIAALTDLRTLLRDYPDAPSTAIRQTISELTGWPASQVVVGNGSENLIEMLCLALLNRGDRVVTQNPCFGLHELYSVAMGATVDKVDFTAGLDFDLAAWHAACARPARMLMIANPSNPVGCALNGPDFERVVAMAPPEAVLLIDEAYYEYAVGPAFPDALAVLQRQQRPWIVLRTLSKAYGLAGIRLGYGLASSAQLVDALERVRTPFNINAVAQAVATAALQDQAYMQASVQRTVQTRATLRQALEQDGYVVAPSHTNFLFFDAQEPAVALAERLLGHGVIVKAWREPGFESFIRVSIGTDAECQQFLSALRLTRSR
jgi:histidinol-phosphate aminotransferase